MSKLVKIYINFLIMASIICKVSCITTKYSCTYKISNKKNIVLLHKVILYLPPCS